MSMRHRNYPFCCCRVGADGGSSAQHKCERKPEAVVSASYSHCNFKTYSLLRNRQPLTQPGQKRSLAMVVSWRKMSTRVSMQLNLATGLWVLLRFGM